MMAVRGIWLTALLAAGCEFSVQGLPIGNGAGGDAGAGAGDLAISAGPDLFGAPELTPRTSGTNNNLNAVWGSGPNDIYVVGDKGTILHSTDQGASWQSATSNTTSNLWSVWGSGPGDVYACGDNGILRHTTDGTTWTTPATLGGACRALWGSSATDLYAVGSGYRISHSTNGTSWNEMQPIGNADSFYGVWGTGPTDVFVVGNHKIVHAVDGMTWDTQYDGPAKLLAIDGLGTQAIAVGAGGVILRFASGQWTAQASGSAEVLNAVWLGGSDGWIAGNKGVVLQAAGGAAWKPVVSGTPVNLGGVWGTSPIDLYFVGGSGTIAHRP
jgi:hypothetical protein